MRIIHWAELFFPHIGGAEVFINNLARSQQQQGHDCLVIADSLDNRFKAHEQYDGVEVRRFPFRAAIEKKDVLAIFRLQKEVLKIAQEFSPDLIHLHTNLPAAFFYLRIQQALAKPMVFTTHMALMENETGGELLVEILNSAKRVVAISAAMKQKILEFNHQRQLPVKLILNSLPQPTIAPEPLSFNPATFLFAGRLVEDKGCEDFLRAFAVVVKKYPLTQALVAGNGIQFEELKTLTTKLNINNNLTFLGWVMPDEMLTFMNRGSVLVMPSRWQEPFGLVALQGMQMARPVIATQVGGLAELVEDQVSGLLVPPKSPTALAEAMLNLLDNPQKTKEMGQAGFLRAEQVFGWEAFLAAYEKIYQEVLEP